MFLFANNDLLKFKVVLKKQFYALLILFNILSLHGVYSQLPPHRGLGKNYAGGEVCGYTVFDYVHPNQYDFATRARNRRAVIAEQK